MIKIKVVGSGCPSCNKLEAMCREIVIEQKMDATIEKISDVTLFTDMGVFMTPGLLINNKLVSSGKVPAKTTLEDWFKEALSE